MIVVDANVLSYYFINGQFTDAAHRCLQADAEWISPSLIVYEFHNVLSRYHRQGLLSLERTTDILNHAFYLLKEFDYLPHHTLLTELAVRSRCTSYDCAYVALAKERDLTLVTADKEVLAAFPELTKSIAEF